MPATAITHDSTQFAEGDIATAPERKDWRRQVIGLFVGLAAAVVIYLLFPDGAADTVAQSAGADAEKEYSAQAMRIVAAVAVWMAVWWMTEAIPLAATALVPLAVFPIMGVAEFKEVSAPYASDTIFLFMGGFMIALGLQRWNLHRRLALWVVKLIGTSPKRIILGFMVATGFLSMWVSNTATAVVMLPIGVSVLTLTAEQLGSMDKQKNFATALMLGIAYSASTGSLGTLIGTPPNLLLAGYMKESHGIEIGFGKWMMFGVPIAVLFTLLAWVILINVFKPEIDEIPGGKELIDDELKKIGRWTPGQILAGVIFVSAALAWVFIPLGMETFGWDFPYTDASVGMIAGLLLFTIPGKLNGIRLLDWETAKDIPWDVLLLFGGGLSLSAMFTKTGLSLWVGEVAKILAGLPVILLIAAVAVLILLLTELTSNTATAATFLPIMGGVATGIGLTSGGDMNVMLLTIPVALSATCAFMLPVATPPNAIAYSSGYVTMGQMIKGGIWLNVIAVVIITLATYFLAVPVFGLVL